MPETSITEIFDLNDGDDCGAVSGKLSSIFKPKTHRKGAKSFTFQDGTLSDASGKEIIKVTFAFRKEAIPLEWKGKLITISEATAKDNEYDGNSERKLWVPPEAEVELAAGSQSSNRTGQQSSSRAEGPSSTGSAKDSVARITKGAAAYLVCLKCAVKISTELGWPPEQAREIGTTLFIADQNGRLDGYGDFQAIGSKAQAPQALPPPPPEPSPDPYDDVPF